MGVYSMNDSEKSDTHGIRSWAHHPIFWMTIAGLAIHIVASMFQIVYDNEYWAKVIRNIEAGEGLYNVVGYYYTPVWGYVLGLVGAFQSTFLSLGADVIRVPEFFFVEIIPGVYYSATAPSLAFALSVKIPLILSNLMLAFILRYLAIDVTGDEKKGNLVFALVFLCPLMIVSSCITAMPDTIAALFAVLTVVLLKKDHHLLAGMTFSIAVLTKFFPVFLFFPLIAYVLIESDDRRIGVRNLVMCAMGATMMTLIIFLPQILAGTLEQCFAFISDRTGSAYEDNLFENIVGKLRIIVYSIVIVISIFTGRWIYRSGRKDSFRNLMAGSMFVMACCMLYPPTPQYVVILIPFLAYWATTAENRYLRSWLLISIFTAIFALSSNLLTVMPIAAWTDLIDVDWLAGWFQTIADGDFSIITMWNIVFGSLTYFSVMHIFLTVYRKKREEALTNVE